jgi:hypothetical protein
MMEKIIWKNRVEDGEVTQGGSDMTGTNCDFFTHK